MNNKIKLISLFLVVSLIGFMACTEDNYSLGDLASPTELVITADVVGKTDAAPNGDGSGNVVFNFSANNALTYKVDYGDGSPVKVYTGSTTVTKTYQKIGINTFRVNVTASGTGGLSTTIIKDVMVRFDYDPGADIITNLTNDSSKTWIVDKSVPGHFGVGPWIGCVTPCWWAAGVDEKVSCCNCFYTTKFTFSIDTNNNLYLLNVDSPDGVFTKTGALAGGLPGIPASGGEGCYPYPGGTSEFAFLPANTGIAADTPSTQVMLKLSGVNTFIGYGAVQKEYEIMVLQSDYMYLRVRGTETGNSWYLKLIPF